MAVSATVPLFLFIILFVKWVICKEYMTKMTSEDEFPEEFNNYLAFLEEETGVPIKIVSVGPDREQTIIRYME